MTETPSYLTSNELPEISEHAYRRAHERLGLGRTEFRAWLSATWSEWRVVPPLYLRDRGVRCSNGDGSVLCTCPWTPTRGVVAAISPDHCMRTIMTFNELPPLSAATAEDPSCVPPERRVYARAMVKLVDDAVAISNPTLKDLVRRAIGVRSAAGDHAVETLKLYADGEVSLAVLRAVLGVEGEERTRRYMRTAMLGLKGAA